MEEKDPMERQTTVPNKTGNLLQRGLLAGTVLAGSLLGSGAPAPRSAEAGNDPSDKDKNTLVVDTPRVAAADSLGIKFPDDDGGPAVEAGPATPITEPQEGSTTPDLNLGLSWEKKPEVTQMQVQLIPHNNDGPGVNLYLGDKTTIDSGNLAVNRPVVSRQGVSGHFIALADMGYTWRVRTSDSATRLSATSDDGWSGWSERHFKTPDGRDSTRIKSVAPLFGQKVDTVTPELHWDNTDKDGSPTDVFYYEVQVSKDPNFETNPQKAIAPVTWEFIHVGEQPAPYLFYKVKPGFPLENDQTYFWRVRPRIQGDGKPVSWSEPLNFRTPVGNEQIPGATDFDLPRVQGVPEGHFYMRTPDKKGYIMINDQQAQLWNAFKALGGVAVLGYPISDRFTDSQSGKIRQATQKGIIEIDTTNGRYELVNVMDVYALQGRSLENHFIPDPAPWDSDQGKLSSHDSRGPHAGSIGENHMRVFTREFLPTANDAQLELLKRTYLTANGTGDFNTALTVFGLPVGAKSYPDRHVVRFQRGVAILTASGVTVLHGGELAKLFGGIIPGDAQEAKHNPYGVGGEPNPVEELIQRAELIDWAEVLFNGKRYRLETRTAFPAGYNVNVAPELKLQLVNLIAKDGEKFGFTDAKVLVLASKDQAPEGINFRAIRDTGLISTQRVNGLIVIYFVPDNNLPLNDAEFSAKVNRGITWELLENTITGGNVDPFTSPLAGKQDHLSLIKAQALRVSKR